MKSGYYYYCLFSSKEPGRDRSPVAEVLKGVTPAGRLITLLKKYPNDRYLLEYSMEITEEQYNELAKLV